MAAASPPEAVQELVERFERNVDAYRSGHYNETQVRLKFINPLFAALGWDMDNEKGWAEACKDVIHDLHRGTGRGEGIPRRKRDPAPDL